MLSTCIRNTLLAALLITVVHHFLVQQSTAHVAGPVAGPQPVAVVAPQRPARTPDQMPLDGLQEMFEFATNGDSWHSCGAGAQLAGDAVPVKEKADCQYPTQSDTNAAVVNTYRDEPAMNGGRDGGVSAFDGWSAGSSYI